MKTLFIKHVDFLNLNNLTYKHFAYIFKKVTMHIILYYYLPSLFYAFSFKTSETFFIFIL